MGRYERPLKLKTNKIPYLIPGGGMIDRFLGEEGRSTASQMWIASVVQCTLDGSRGSRSYIEEGKEEVCLADEIAREPGAYLGKAFYDKFGSNLGFLLKLLNSRDRLLVRTHPDKERAQKYFGSRFGKTESWYVVDTEPGKEAYIWAGFRQGVTREGFLDLIRKNVKIHPWGEERNLIGYETTELFAMKSVLCHDECERENHVFMVGLVLKGNGWVEYGDHVRIPVKKGTELFIPHGVKHYRYIPGKYGSIGMLSTADIKISEEALRI